VVGAVLAVVAVVAEGPRGALSVWLGTLLVAGFFWTVAVPLFVVQWGGQARAGTGTALLLLTYTLRLAVAVAVLRVAGRSAAVLPVWTGVAIIVGAVVWTSAQAVAVLRAPSSESAERTGR
jgi:hypothetical protein